MNQNQVETREEQLNLAVEAHDADAPLVVEIPSEIRAGVRAQVAARPSCSPYSSCYRILAV